MPAHTTRHLSEMLQDLEAAQFLLRRFHGVLRFLLSSTSASFIERQANALRFILGYGEIDFTGRGSLEFGTRIYTVEFLNE